MYPRSRHTPLAAALLLCACSSESTPTAPAAQPPLEVHPAMPATPVQAPAVGGPSSTSAAATGAGEASSQAIAGEGLSDGPPVAGAAAPEPSTEDGASMATTDLSAGTQVTGGRPSMGSTPVACEAQRVLQASCQGCHAADPRQLAPMALVTREDLLAPAISDPDQRVIDLVVTRTHSEAARMPPTPSRALTPTELAVLSDLQQDMPAGPASCAYTGAEQDIAPEAPDESKIDQCYRFVAHEHESKGDETPFVAPSGEYYGCFFFEIPWQEGAQAITFRSLDTALTHHWALSDTVQQFEPGQVVRDAPNCGLGAEHLLAVYGINQQKELSMPEGVGLQLPGPASGRGILLGVHFFNPGDVTEDQAGVEVCTAREPQPNEATVSILGSEFFLLPPGQETTVQSTCTPSATEDIHIFRLFPHMHARGVSFESLVQRADGSQEPLLDIAYDFNNQIMYETPVVLHPGDRMRTTCQFRNTSERLISVGDLEADEMCINFAYAWPAHALANGQALSGASDTCLQ